jgi:cytochrome P450
MKDGTSEASVYGSSVSRASLIDTFRTISSIVLPTFGKGIIIRRPTMEAAAERMGFDTGAVKAMQRLRRKYGPGPLHLPIPGRPQLLLFDPADVSRTLNETPRPFATDTTEKRAALNHFEPDNVLIADPDRRRTLRPLHEEALRTRDAVHPLNVRFREIVEYEFGNVLREAANEIGWPAFAEAWFRVVRRTVLGDRARNDEELTELLNALRRRVNWAFLRSRDRAKRKRLHACLQHYIAHPEEGSLVSMMRRDTKYSPSSQIAQWLFAFDPAGMTTFRTLALLASHPKFGLRAREEGGEIHSSSDFQKSFTRRCVLEALRLWPTTPVILRQTIKDLSCNGTPLRRGTGVIIFTPFFGRDDEKLDFANRMSPEIWNVSDADALPEFGIFPFSGGPAICPAHNLVPFVAWLTISVILGEMDLSLLSPKLDVNRLPGTLNHFNIRLGVARRRFKS